MRFLIQRVKHADVSVDDATIGKIERGLLVFIGISETDTEETCNRMIDKLLKMRIFEDADGKTNLSIRDIEGSLLLISQFTLYANCRRGNRPSFTEAGNPTLANSLYEYIIKRCSLTDIPVQHGSFGADMKVSLLNDGPFTIMLDSEELKN